MWFVEGFINFTFTDILKLKYLPEFGMSRTRGEYVLELFLDVLSARSNFGVVGGLGWEAVTLSELAFRVLLDLVLPALLSLLSLPLLG